MVGGLFGHRICLDQKTAKIFVAGLGDRTSLSSGASEANVTAKSCDRLMFPRPRFPRQGLSRRFKNILLSVITELQNAQPAKFGQPAIVGYEGTAFHLQRSG